LCNVNNVMPEPRPDVQISKFTVEGPMIVARACTHNDHYWQVYFDISRIVERELGRAVYPLVPLVPVVPAAPEVPAAPATTAALSATASATTASTATSSASKPAPTHAAQSY
jgi:hypothetical protein